MVDVIITKYSNLLEFDHSRLVDKIECFSLSIFRKNSVLENLIGFIDGTAIQMAIPSMNQRKNFSGNKRFHC